MEQEVQQTMKFLRNKLALWVLAALAVGGVAFLVLAAGANVNCTGGVCYSTNGRTTDTTVIPDCDPNTSGNQPCTNDANTTTGVFTGENDTGSIECRSAGDTTFSLGGGNDVAYLVNPQANLASITVEGEDGDDVIVDGCFRSGGSLTNFLNGGNGNDVIIQNGADPDSSVDDSGRLYGGAGNDLLAGGQGNDVLGDTDGNGSCSNESDPGNDVLVGGPGTDNYCTADNDGNDIVIIHAGDVPAGAEETYSCEGDDTILLFGFNSDLVVTLNPGQSRTINDPVNNPTGSSSGARYTFTADNTGATGTCTIIVVD
jgi:Ca2+-binding RTX toxin-like protein